MESYFEEKVREYFERLGWKFLFPDKIRGMQPDFIVEKDGKISIIEVRGERADLDNGIKKALHFKNAGNYSYLALPEEVITKKTVNVCENLGIGLLGIGNVVHQISEPEQTQALESVKNRIYKIKKEKPIFRKKSLLDLLFRSNTLVRILKVLFLNQTREYYLHELADQIGASPSTTLRELDKIKPLNLITKSGQRYITYYKINRSCIIYDELKKIFLKFELTDELISKELEKFDIKYALIYGSFARGTETETSDMDLLIIGNVDRDSILFSLSNLQSKIGREINFILWTEEEFKEKIKQKISLLSNIKQNQILMIKGMEDEFRAIIE